jgi:tight adherence protein C
MELYLIVGSVFTAVFLFFFALLYFISRRNDPIQARLKELEEGSDEYEAEKKRLLFSETAAGLFSMGKDQASGTKLWLAQAGYRAPQSVFNYYGMRLFCAVLLGILSAACAVYFHLELALVVLLPIVGLLVGSQIPLVWVYWKVTRRRDEIRRSVPGVLDLIVVCVEAGLSLNAAIQKITEETKDTYKALGEELHLLNQEILIGKTRAEAFRNLARRTGVDELRSLAVMLIQSDKLGTSIAGSLRVLADSLRVKRRQRAEEAAHKTQVKLVFPLVLLVFPELMVILVGPAMINLIKTLAEMAR